MYSFLYTGQNLLEDSSTRLLSVMNYTVDELPNELLHETVVNLAFTSIGRASLEETSITIEFDEVYLINELRLEGCPSGMPTTTWKAGDPFCYMVDVSRDLYQWIRVLNYSNLKCYSMQQLYFPKQAVKYVVCTRQLHPCRMKNRASQVSYGSRK